MNKYENILLLRFAILQYAITMVNVLIIVHVFANKDSMVQNAKKNLALMIVLFMANASMENVNVIQDLKTITATKDMLLMGNYSQMALTFALQDIQVLPVKKSIVHKNVSYMVNVFMENVYARKGTLE